MPALIEFKLNNPDERYEIIAFHASDVKSFEELDENLEERNIPARFWDGRDLPFPVFLDATGETFSTYGISAMPMHLLIDPEGTLVGVVDGAEGLRRALEGASAASD